MVLTDRILAEKPNAKVRGAKSPGDEIMPNLKQTRLFDEILKAVEQELLMAETYTIDA